MSNETKYYLRGAFACVSNLFISGGILQTFFADIGFTSRQIGAYTSMISIVQVIVMILSIFFADTAKNVKRTMALFTLSPVLFCFVMLAASLIPSPDPDRVFLAAMVICFFQNIFLGFNNVLHFRLIYIVTESENFSRLENKNAVFSGILSIGISALVPFLSTMFPFRSIMTVGFIVSIVFLVVTSLLLHSMKPRSEFTDSSPRSGFSFSMLLDHKFRYFYLPNFLRGCASGLMGIIAVICIREISDDVSVVSSLPTILSVASIACSCIYQPLRKKFGTAVIYLLSSVIMCLLLPMMLLWKAPLIFCLLYFIVCIGYSAINIAGALYATEYVPYQDIGSYTSVRLIVMTSGQALASYGVTILLDHLPAVAIVILCGAAQLISGAMYFYYDHRYVRPRALSGT